MKFKKISNNAEKGNVVEGEANHEVESNERMNIMHFTTQKIDDLKLTLKEYDTNIFHNKKCWHTGSQLHRSLTMKLNRTTTTLSLFVGFFHFARSGDPLIIRQLLLYEFRTSGFI